MLRLLWTLTVDKLPIPKYIYIYILYVPIYIIYIQYTVFKRNFFRYNPLCSAAIITIILYYALPYNNPIIYGPCVYIHHFIMTFS